MQFRLVYATAKQLFHKMVKDDCPGLAAEMVYHLIMVSAPGLILVFTLFGLFGNQQQVVEQFFYYANQIFPQEVLTLIRSLVTTIIYGGSRGIAIIGFFSALWAASNGAKIMIKALRRAYIEVDMQEASHPLSFLQEQMLAFLIIFSLGLAMVFASYLLIFGNIIFDHLRQWHTLPIALLLHLLQWFVVIGFIVAISAFIYRLVPGYPHKKVAWKDAIAGAAFFVLLWIALSILFSIYVQHFGRYNQIYGTLGAFIVMMLWLYFSSLAFLLGGELNSLQLKNQMK